MTAQLEEFTVAGDNQAVVGVKWCHDGECGYWYHVVTLRRDKIIRIQDYVSRSAALSSVGLS